MNAFDKVSGVSADGAKYCTKEVFDKMKATWTKPGDAGWFYVPTIDADTGIAFNLSEKGPGCPDSSARSLARNLLLSLSSTAKKVSENISEVAHVKFHSSLREVKSAETPEI